MIGCVRPIFDISRIKTGTAMRVRCNWDVNFWIFGTIASRLVFMHFYAILCNDVLILCVFLQTYL